jgi:hypothetical protein
MSLYLTIFDGDTEVVGWVLGHYSDFGVFRDMISDECDRTRYPTLLLHADSDGEWTVREAVTLKKELHELGDFCRTRPARKLQDAFEHTADCRQGAVSLYDCFHNVNGENLFEALMLLCEEAERRQLPILFQ